MLIKQAQIAAMDQDAEKRFLDRMVRFVIEEHYAGPEDSSSAAQCKILTCSARYYELGTELEIATFVCCGFVYGLDFDKRPDLPFAQILSDIGLAAEFKSERMAYILDQDFYQ